MPNPSDVNFMLLALAQAHEAQRLGEVPVGAVLVHRETVIATGANRPISACDPTAHAEIEALRAGARALGSYRLTDTTLYVTLEPCVMCAAALRHARVRRVVFGTFAAREDPASGAVDRLDMFGGVMARECGELLQKFFAGRRA
jgi:tRNA(adenine34) deaminase